MKNLVLGTFLTLDGVRQAPGEPQEDREGDFKHDGWQLRYFDADAGIIMGEQIAAINALLLGRLTYELFAAFRASTPKDDPIAKKLNSVPKYVVSTTLNKAWWNKSTLIRQNIAQVVAELNGQPDSGNLSVIGSGKLAQTQM
jgi:dihydrofolate reductase